MSRASCGKSQTTPFRKAFRACHPTDGALAIDNNAAERAVKPFAIGRKNWLFFGSDHGGQRLAILSSFTATCQQLGRNPWTWLKDTLTNLRTPPADQLATLLPTPTK